VVALLDCDHEVVGREVAGITVGSVEDLERALSALLAKLAR
jgi:NADH/NAD ratio-sensing transcriptional regulator Rex